MLTHYWVVVSCCGYSCCVVCVYVIRDISPLSKRVWSLGDELMDVVYTSLTKRFAPTLVPSHLQLVLSVRWGWYVLTIHDLCIWVDVIISLTCSHFPGWVAALRVWWWCMLLFVYRCGSVTDVSDSCCSAQGVLYV